MTIEIIEPRSTVLVCDSIQATVVAATIRPAHNGAFAVLYDCEWWDDRDIKCGTFSSFQVRPIGDVRPAQIGFNPGSSD